MDTIYSTMQGVALVVRLLEEYMNPNISRHHDHLQAHQYPSLLQYVVQEQAMSHLTGFYKSLSTGKYLDFENDSIVVTSSKPETKLRPNKEFWLSIDDGKLGKYGDPVQVRFVWFELVVYPRRVRRKYSCCLPRLIARSSTLWLKETRIASGSSLVALPR